MIKKIWLLAAAALMTASANAQLASYNKVGKPQSSKKTVNIGAIKAERFGMESARNVALQTNRPMGVPVAKANPKVAKFANKHKVEGEFVSEAAYTAIGKAKSDGQKYTWTMELGKIGTSDVVRNIVPTIFEGGELDVVATRSGNTITIQPQMIASTENYDIYIESSTADNGVITLTLDAQKHISLPAGEGILLGAFTGDYDPDHGASYLGYYETYNNITYYATDETIPVPAPAVYADGTTRGMLYAGMGRSGYSFTYNLCTLPADCDFTFTNYTSDDATEWRWNADVPTADGEGVDHSVTGADYDFNLPVEANSSFTNINVVGSNLGNESSPFTIGFGAAKEKAYFYGGGGQNQFEFTDGTCATMTLNDPNNTIKFYTNWATPDLYSTSISKIYAYGFKPAKPLFITGIEIPVVNFEAKKGFELTCKIYQAQREGGSSLILGDVIAQCTITEADVDMTYAEEVGLATLQFNNLKVLDEDGMESEIDHLFLDQEFAVVIEGWDNGTFSAVIGSQESDNANGPTSTWFEQTEKPGSKYSYGNWPTLFIGYAGATYGYLSTDDDTNVTLATNGGSATLTIRPMYKNNDGSETQTRLFVEGEVPEWINLDITNEDYINDFKFDLNVSAEPLPAGVEGRQATIRLWQEGAYIDLFVSQGKQQTSDDPSEFDHPDYSTYPDVLYVKDETVKIGHQTALPILLNNTEQYTALQFDVTLPESITLGDEGINLGSRAMDHNIEYALQPNGDYRVMVTSLNNEVFGGNSSEEVATIAINVPDSLEEGILQLRIKNQKMIDVNANSVLFEESICNLNVEEDFILGDVTNDSIIDTADYVGLTNIILEKNNYKELSHHAADVNQDNKINAGDYVGIVNYTLYGSFTPDTPNMVAADNASETTINVNSIKAIDEQHIMATLNFNGTFDVTALQFDITMPEGLSLTSAAYFNTDNASSHNILTNTLENGKVRLFSASTKNASIDTNDAELMTLTFKIDSNINTVGNIELNNIALANKTTAVTYPDNVMMDLEETTGIINTNKHNVMDANVYTIAGQKVNRQSIKKGVYLIGGKKVVK